MRRFWRGRGLFALIIALFLVIALGVSSSLFPSRFPFLANAFGSVVSPIQNGIAQAVGWVNQVSDYMTDFDALKAENESLKLEIAKLEAQMRDAERSEQENKRLHTLLHLQEKRKDFTFEAATVVSRGSSNWSSTMTLSKGSAGGVAVDNCVVTETGALVGIVKEVGFNWCTVISVIDTDLQIGGTSFQTGEMAILEGDFALMTERRLKLSYLAEDSTISPGDLILTSGRGGIYPSGLLVGRVVSLKTDVSGISQYAVVKPEADLEQLSQVFIIRSFDITE
ncbi:MAG: rod shape-determining protein MreC [Oscillospiraceae bacterium]|jgi:rod shape-determining protein MreC